MVEKKIKVRLLVAIAVLLFGGLAFGDYTVQIDGGDYDFTYRRIVTIQSGQVQGGPHGDFPMLFDSKTDAGLQTDLASAAGKVESPDGYDIVFATTEGVEIFSHEIEKYDSSNGEYVAWIKIPNPPGLSDGTQFYLYYGSTDITDENPDKDTQHATDVWSNGYTGVWHLEETSGIHYDSTSNNYSGTIQGTVNQNATGKINGADEFVGPSTESWISLADGTLTANSAFTIEAWFQIEVMASWMGIVTKGRDVDPDWVGLWVGSDEIVFGWDYRDPPGNVHGSTLSAGPRYYAVATFDGTSNKTLYLNGGYDGGDSGPNSYPDIPQNTRIATAESGAPYFDGIIDEVRFSNTPRSANWIETCYNNQDSPASFYAVGGEQTLVVLSYFRAKGLDSAVLLEWATETELDNEGFNILRSEEEDWGYVRINPYLIPARGTAGFGAEYSYVDYDVENGVTYYYLLEDIDFHGKSTLHGPVSATPHDIILIWPPDWEPLASGASLFSWASSGDFSFKVDVSAGSSFQDSTTLSFPNEGWTSNISLWLQPEEWETILSKAQESRGHLFWRIRAKRKDGRVFCSDWKRFVVESNKLPEE